MKKIVVFIGLILVTAFGSGCTSENMVQMPNPWVDCGDNLQKAANVAGFRFPLVLSNYQVRAMKDMFEITYPLDEKRSVTVRKSESNETGDISGDYKKYSVNKTVMLKGAVPVEIRGDGEKVYVINMAGSSGYYSARCPQGMTMREVEGIYEVIAEAEAPKN